MPDIPIDHLKAFLPACQPRKDWRGFDFVLVATSHSLLKIRTAAIGQPGFPNLLIMRGHQGGSHRNHLGMQ